MEKANLSEFSKCTITITRISQYMVSFFTQITQFCINQLSARLQPEKKDTAQNLPKIDENFVQSSQQSLAVSEPKKQQGYKKKRRRNMQEKPQFLLNKPKAPTSSYLIYLHSAKNDISAKYNITNVAQLTKLVSLQWKKLTEQEKEQYNTKSELQKQRYKDQMQIYKKKYASQIKAYQRQKQVKYKINWIENKKKKAKENLNAQKSGKIDQLKRRIKLSTASLEENESEFSEEKDKQDQRLDHG